MDEDAPGRGPIQSQELVRAASWVIAERWGSRLLSLVTFVVLSRMIGPAAFGLMAMVMTYVELCRLLVDQGVSEAIISRQETDHSMLSTAFWGSLLLGVATGATTLAVAPVVGLVFGEHALVPMVQAMSVFFLVQGLSCVPEAVLQRDLQFQLLAKRRLAAGVAGSVVGVACATSGLGAWSLVAQALTSAVIGVAILWLRCEFRPGLDTSRNAARSLTRFGINAVSVNVLNYVNGYGDNIVVGLVLGPTELGIYSVAFRILALLNELFTGALSTLSGPLFGRLRTDHDAIRRALMRLTTIGAGVGLPLYALALLSAPVVVPAVFGAEWSSAIPVMQWLIVGMALWTVNFFDKAVLYATGHLTYELVITAVAALRTVTAAAIGAAFSLEAVAACVGVAMYVTWPLRLVLLRRAVQINLAEYLANFGRIALAVGAAVLAAYLLALPVPSGTPSVAARCLLFIVAYLGLSRLLVPSLQQMVRSLKSARTPAN